MEKFSKYIGVQGVIAVLLIIGYIVSALIKIELPREYTYFTALVLGFYFAKNGVGIIDALKGNVKKQTTVTTLKSEE